MVLFEKFRLPRSTPEQQGIPSTAISVFLDEVSKHKIDVHSMMLLRHGKVVAEGWWTPYNAQNKHMLFSLTKSFISTAIGFAITDGLLALEDKVVSFFPEYEEDDMDEKMLVLTVRHLLTMSAGYFENISGSGVWNQKRGDWVKEFLELPLTYEPGEKFIYNSGSSHMLSAIITKVTGKTALDYLKEKLFNKLEIDDIIWTTDQAGNHTGGWGLNLKTEDIAKFGQFYLQHGIWNGEQLLPADWIQEATTIQISTEHLEGHDSRVGYGYQFWLCRNHMYRGEGAFGQICLVVPGQEAVLVLTGGHNQGDKLMDLFFEHLLPHMGDIELPLDQTEIMKLEHRLTMLNIISDGNMFISPLVAKLSGCLYEMQANIDHIHTITFNFNEQEHSFHMEDDQGQHVIHFGIGSWIQGETTMPGSELHHGHSPSSIKVEAIGEWRDDKTLVMTWCFVETSFYDTVTCRFEGKKLIYVRAVNINNGLLKRPTILGRTRQT